MRNLKELSSEEHGIDIRDTKRILLGLAGVKVAYDGTNTQTRNIYDHVEGETRKHGGFFEGKKDTDIFIYAMCLGKKLGDRLEFQKDDVTGKIDKKANIDIEYFANQPEYVWMMIATALEDTKDPQTGDPTMDVFKNPKIIVEICQEYANAGMHELIKILDKRSGEDPFRGFDLKIRELLKYE